MKTNLTCQTSIALVYATGGRVEEIEAVWVDIVSSVVTPSATRAGTAYIVSSVVTTSTTRAGTA